MKSLCPYRNMFGEPGKGVHGIRIFDIAIIDVLFTVIAGILIAYYWKLNTAIVLVVLFVTGIIAHRMFCVRTTIDKLLFP